MCLPHIAQVLPDQRKKGLGQRLVTEAASAKCWSVVIQEAFFSIWEGHCPQAERWAQEELRVNEVGQI